MPRQLALWCACGNSLPQISRLNVLCAICLRRRRLSLEKFDGGREAAFLRDSHSCQICGGIDDLVCHHRSKNVLAILCRADHARVHHLARLRFGFPETLKRFWREWHREQPEQLELSFQRPAVSEQEKLFRAES